MSITEREGTRAPVTTVISSNHAVVPRHMRELAPLLSIHPKGRLYYCIHFTEKENRISVNVRTGIWTHEVWVQSHTWRHHMVHETRVPGKHRGLPRDGVPLKWSLKERGAPVDLRDRLGHGNFGEKWVQHAKGLTCLVREFGLDSKTPRTWK